MEYAVRMKNIVKQFPKVLANDHVNFDVYKGEIHALVGENGAGKSTLMNILYGLHTPTSGEIYINGNKVEFYSAMDAIAHGIGMVHQHFMLIGRLTVADNVVLGQEPGTALKYQRKEAIKNIEQICNEYGLNVDPRAKVSEISLGMQQRVEIIKTLYRKAEILILDEPTAVLTPQEIDELGVILKKLKSMGKTIIIITHKLKEVIDFSDRVTVLRSGKVIGTVETHQTTPEEITQMMVGRSVKLGGEKQPTHFTENVLELNDICYKREGQLKLKNITLSIKKGEILGIAGVDNSGQTELTEVIMGIIRTDHGSITLNGSDITKKSTDEIKKLGVGFVPQDRQKNGLALDFSVSENLILGHQRRKSFLKRFKFQNFDSIKKNAVEKINRFDIRPPNASLPASNLSGGNQQKLIIAREVGFATELIVAEQPTRGVDIGAIESIHQTLVEARNKGLGILFVSLELDEVMLISDRIAVMHDGEIMGILDAKDATREKIGLMMAGKKYEEIGEAL